MQFSRYFQQQQAKPMNKSDQLVQANETIAQLEAKVKAQAELIAEYVIVSEQKIALESQVLDLNVLTDALIEQVAATPEADAFNKFAEVWFQSTIGKRANRNENVDLSAMSLGLSTKNFGLVQVAYVGILDDIALHPEEDSKPVSDEEQAEITDVMRRLGFIHD